MKSKSIFLILSLFIILFFSAANLLDIETELCSNFVHFLNNRKLEDASKLCSDSLKVNFKYSNTLKNKTTFFSYLTKRASVNQQLFIDSTININGEIIVYTKYSNAFNQYLKLHKLPLKYSFTTNNNLINELIIDSLKGYNDSLRVNDKRWSNFEKWTTLKHNGINITYIKLQYPDSLIVLAKEFYNSEVKK